MGGKFLGRLFNEMASTKVSHQGENAASGIWNLHDLALCQPAFQYKHQGVFVYVGDSKAIAQLQTANTGSAGELLLNGSQAYAAYTAVYFSKLLSLRNRFMYACDWVKTRTFGRDPSRC